MDPSFDIEAARRNYRRRMEERKEKRLEQWRLAKEQADTAVGCIIDQYNPDRVIQWGSILRPELFTEVSNIDIADEGIADPETWSRMESEVSRLVTFPLDLVPFEKIRPEHQRSILARGKVIYERQ